MNNKSDDTKTAQAFANSWNNLPTESVYTVEQFEDWFAPLAESDIKNKKILELGCGNGSLLVHLQKWMPNKITGVDLGDSVNSANLNMMKTGFNNYEIIKAKENHNGYNKESSIP